MGIYEGNDNIRLEWNGVKISGEKRGGVEWINNIGGKLFNMYTER